MSVFTDHIGLVDYAFIILHLCRRTNIIEKAISSKAAGLQSSGYIIVTFS